LNYRSHVVILLVDFGSQAGLKLKLNMKLI